MLTEKIIGFADALVSLFLKSIEMFLILKYIHFCLDSFIKGMRQRLQVNHVKQSFRTIQVVRSKLHNSPASSSKLHGPLSKSGTL